MEADLTSHGELMTDLTFSSSEFSIQFRNRSSFDTT